MPGRRIYASPPEAAPAPMPRMRVLAAEDNKTNQLVLRKVIKALDLELEIVPNGREAVRLFEEFHPHLIFMDISMPEMDGKEATGEIRRLEAEAGGHVPIVALTAHAIDEDGQSALDAGLDHYLTKPLRKTAILERIRDAVPKDVADPFADVES